MTSSTILTLLTIFGSASCAIVGIFVNRHISVRQVKMQEAGSMITNAEYWREEVATFKSQIEELRKQLEEAEKQQNERDKKIADQKNDIEKLTMKYFQATFDNNNLVSQLESMQGKTVQRKPYDNPLDQPKEVNGA